MKIRTIGRFVGALALAGVCLATEVVASPANYAPAVADPGRTADDKARDADRKPAEMLDFAKVKAGQTVVDFMPGGGYFTRLFLAAVGPKGKVYAFIPTEVAGFSKKPLPANGSSPDPAHPNLMFLVAPVMQFSTPTPVDMVWTSQNYHDLQDPFMGPADLSKFNAAVFKALKPGGLYVILDHAAAAGSGVSATNTLHRIDPEVVKKEVTAAGFVYEGSTEVLRNSADDHSLNVFKPDIRGHTDQFLFRFRKPK